MPYANLEQDKAYHREYSRQWQLENREKTKASVRRWNDAHPDQILFASARRRAEKNGIAFNLDVTDVVIPEKCPALGIPLIVQSGATAGSRRPRPNAPSLDRIKPELGYIKGNVQVISWRANELKKNATGAELRAVADFVSAQEDR